MNDFERLKGFNKNRVKEIDLKELYNVIRKRIWLVILLTLVFALAGINISHSSSKVLLYQSSSRIIIGADEESRKTLQVIIRDSTILDKVASEIGINRSADTLAGQITVASIDSSQVVSITVVDENPILAVKIANATAQIFRDQVPKIVGKDYVRILSLAKLSNSPINKGTDHTIMIAALIGLIAGIGFVFLLDSLDDTISKPQEVEEMIGLPILGRVSRMNKKNTKKKNNNQLNFDFRGETVGLK